MIFKTLCIAASALNLKLFHVFAQLNEEFIKEFSVQIFAHLVQDKPIADRAIMNVRFDSDRVFFVFKVSKGKRSVNCGQAWCMIKVLVSSTVKTV